MSGGERVLKALSDMFPQADIYVLVADPKIAGEFRPHKVIPSFLNRVPGVRRFHRHFLPLYPIALEQFDLRQYDLVLSSDSGPAKGVLTPTRACHICYCHSPMRYLWDLYHEYINGKDMGSMTRMVFSAASHYLRMWDVAAAQRVDYFVANSHNVARRINKNYRRDATVIHPPVDVLSANISNQIDDYYLSVGRLVDYKRVDLAIAACNDLRRPLRVVGDGPQYRRLKSIAGPTIEFLGALSDEALKEQYAHCRALLFPGEEDFGIVPVEAQAFGRPVIAYGVGGVLETVRGLTDVDSSEATGIFFQEQSASSMTEAISELERIESQYNPMIARENAERFDISSFKSAMNAFIAAKMEEFRSGMRSGPSSSLQEGLLANTR